MPTSPEDFLTSIISPLLDVPHALRIEKINDDRGILLSVNIAKEDMPKIIGRSGATAMAIRNLVRVWGARNKMHVSMKINEPEE